MLLLRFLKAKRLVSFFKNLLVRIFKNKSSCSYIYGLQLTALPKNVAYKFAKANKKHFFLLETHIDNPGLSKGVVLNFGIKLFYTEEPR